jgi:hypothetical protein
VILPALARRALTPLLVAVCVLALAVVSAASGAAGSSSGGEPPGADAFTKPRLQQGLAEARAEEQRRAEMRATPDAAAERNRSRTAYRGQSRAQALALAMEKHRAVVAAPLWRPLLLRGGDAVKEYRGDYDALVEVDDGKNLLATSTLPMRALDESGELAPVRLDLEERGGAFVPANPLIELTVSKDPAAGVAFERAGFSFGLDGARAPEEPVVTEGRAFYPNVAVDTDLVIQPMALGVETFVVVRSADSPESQTLAFDLGAGGELRRAGGTDRAVEIVRDGKMVARVEAPAAWDADSEPVPVSYDIAGSKLIVRFPHQAGDYAYPIVVDPIVGDHVKENFNLDGDGNATTGTTPGYTNDPFANWQYAESRPVWGYYKSTDSSNRGLTVYGYQGVAYLDNDYSEWYWVAPRAGSAIERADFGYVTTTNRYRTCTIEGIYVGDPKWDWDYGSWGDVYGNTGPSPTLRSGEACRDLTNNYKAHCVGANCNPDGTRRNMAVFGMLKFGAETLGTYPVHRMEGSTLWVYDYDKPAFTAFGLSGAQMPSGWTHSAKVTADVSAHEPEPGLGIYRYRIKRNGSEAKSKYASCMGFGDRNGYCPAAWATGVSMSTEAGADYTIPEGASTLDIEPVDAVNRAGDSRRVGTVYVDRSSPSVTLSGALYDARGGSRSAGAYGLTIDARDPYSGVASVKLYVDGASVPVNCSGAASAKTCTYTFETNEHGLGQHSFRVVADDALAASHAGHTTEHPPFTVTFGRPADYTECVSDGGEPEWCELHNRDDQPASDPEPSAEDDPDPADPAATPHHAQCEGYFGSSRALGCSEPVEDPFDISDTLAPDATFAAAADAPDATTSRTTRPFFGIADDENPGMFDDARFKALGIKKVRRIVPYNLVRDWGPRAPTTGDPCVNPGSNVPADQHRRFEDFVRWYCNAVRYRYEMTVSFEYRDARTLSPDPEGRREDAADHDHVPGGGEYLRAIQQFDDMFPAVRWYSAWNEPNNSPQPTRLGRRGVRTNSGRGPRFAAMYTSLAQRLCLRIRKPNGDGRGCGVVAGDLILQPGNPNGRTGWRTWLVKYREALRSRNADPRRRLPIPDDWAFHPYRDVYREISDLTKTGTHLFYETIPTGSDVWLLEIGSNVDAVRPNPPNTLEDQRREVRYLVTRLAKRIPSYGPVERLYYYQWKEPVGDKYTIWDSGLISPNNPKDPRLAEQPDRERSAYFEYRAATNPNHSTTGSSVSSAEHMSAASVESGTRAAQATAGARTCPLDHGGQTFTYYARGQCPVSSVR